jgi:hypothetical protein
MPIRPNRTSACCRRFAAPKALTLDQGLTGAPRALPAELTNRQAVPYNSTVLGGGIAVFDTFVFEFMGLAMFALCVVVLAVPSRRPPVRHARDH